MELEYLTANQDFLDTANCQWNALADKIIKHSEAEAVHSQMINTLLENNETEIQSLKGMQLTIQVLTFIAYLYELMLFSYVYNDYLNK